MVNLHICQENDFPPRKKNQINAKRATGRAVKDKS